MPACPAPIVQLLPPPHDNEWIKTLVSLIIGAALGVLSALIIEPLKIKRRRKIEANLGENFLYEELGVMLALFRLAVSQPEKECLLLCKRIRFEKFEYYFEKRREIFYSMRDHVGIRRLHGQIALNLSPEQIEKNGANHQIRELASAYEYAMRVGEIDRERVENAARRQNAESEEKGPVLHEHIVSTQMPPTKDHEEIGQSSHPRR